MRKVYKKPEVVFVSFELSESISAGCEQISNQAEYACAVEDTMAELTYITEGITGCNYTPPNVYDLVCYHAPSDSANVFSS